MPDTRVSLDDKYTQDHGTVYLSGTQALVRLLMLQQAFDKQNGLTTAGYVSGYRGSPLSAFDVELWRAKDHLERHNILFQPGLNEDLAATHVMGTQLVEAFPGPKQDGVFAAWYGKAPGVDRSGDAFKHGNSTGTAKHGGVLCLAGDDHAAKSTSTAFQSEYAFLDAMIPVLAPANPQDFIDFGLWGWAMSRYAGVWVGFKMTDANVNTSATVILPTQRAPFLTPNMELPPDGLNSRWPDNQVAQEARLHHFRIPAVGAFARANPIDRLVHDSTQARIGIIAAGKAWMDVSQAFNDLGIDDEAAEALGLRVYKPGLTWPLEQSGLLKFAKGLEEILVIEEKRGFIEDQMKTILYDHGDGARPRIVGKSDETGTPLIPATLDITPALVAQAIAGRIVGLTGNDRLKQRAAQLAERSAGKIEDPLLARGPYFCSGCPHNTSTVVPEGSEAMGGIGCHGMAVFYERATTFTHMGAEGASWVGMAPFTDTPHMFQNLGDGTYYHSGILALRAAIAAKTNVTYKILFNDAVAMTGGQPVEGQPTVAQISRQVAAEGVKQIVVVSDEPDKYHWREEFAKDVTFRHRDELDQVQRELREIPGVTVLLYDQTCAAEKRRRRKRGTFPDPAKRVFINDLVCEGCGDCVKGANCVSVVPLETEFGRKRSIDQSSCNKDFSCLKGFCPSFVTVEGGTLKKPAALGEDIDPATLPMAALPPLDEAWPILITGIGGTGVVTIGQVLGVAAHMEGKGAGISDIMGLSQKGGSVLSQVTIAAHQDDIGTAQVPPGAAKALIACDIVTAAMPEALSKLRGGVTRAVVNLHEIQIGPATQNPDMPFPADEMRARIGARLDTDRADWLQASNIALALIGDTIAANMFMAGYAWQRGLIPLKAETIEQAIRLNGTAVDANLKAFRWGRKAAVDPASVDTVLESAGVSIADAPTEDLDALIDRRAAFLTDYQDAAYARAYRDRVEAFCKAEAEKLDGSTTISKAVARSLFKLMAYKDEYEVARLWSDPKQLAKITGRFDGDIKLKAHLAPPLFARRDPVTGLLKKEEYGPWAFKIYGVLRRMKGLRGSWADPFGHTAERRKERALIRDYTATIEDLAQRLTPENADRAADIAALPMQIRGYGHIKEKAIADYEATLSSMMAGY